MKKLLINIPSILALLLMIFFIILIINFGVLSTKYLVIVIIVELVVYLLGLLLYNRKNKFVKVLGILLLILLSIGNGVGYYYISKANNYLNNNFSVDKYRVTTPYYLVGNTNNTYTILDDIKTEDKIYYYKYSQSVDKSLKKIKNNEPVETIELHDTLNNITNDNSMLLVSKADYEYAISASNDLNEENYKIIVTFDVTEYFKINKSTPESFNVYINGLDYSGNRRDFNMLVTINTKTHKVVLTSIPRDYYIYVPQFDSNYTLTSLGSVDSQVAKEALEQLFNTKIDYTLNLYTESLVKVVDTIGGVEFCSDKTFTTVHDTTIGSYADKGDKVLVESGCHTYNGLETLAIARERVNISDVGDRGRVDNDRQIIKNIGKKLATVDTLKNYNEILNSLEGTYTSNISRRAITELIKKTLDNPKYEIIEQKVDGRDTMEDTNKGRLWALIPYQDTVDSASKKINSVLKEK